MPQQITKAQIKEIIDNMGFDPVVVQELYNKRRQYNKGRYCQEIGDCVFIEQDCDSVTIIVIDNEELYTYKIK
jgi:hypothetical protein